jgi:hypothetical protein
MERFKQDSRWVPGPRKGCMPQAVSLATGILIGIILLLVL